MTRMFRNSGGNVMLNRTVIKPHMAQDLLALWQDEGMAAFSRGDMTESRRCSDLYWDLTRACEEARDWCSREWTPVIGPRPSRRCPPSLSLVAS